MNFSRRLTWGLTLASCGAVSITCESPTAPRGVGQRVGAGVTISGRITPGDVQRYSFLVEQDGEYAVFLAAAAGTAQLAVLDSQHFQQAAQLSAGPASGPLLSNATADFLATKGTVLLITVGAQTAVGFEFQVFVVNPAPERRAATFSLGDTVSGEDIDPVADVDNFWMQGQAGQEIVVVPVPLGPTGAGTLEFLVTDSTTNVPVAFAANDAGSSQLTTTALFRLPSTGRYRFQLRGVEGINSNVGPRYTGPYRFWSYAINRAPEHLPPNVTIGAVVQGEKIDRAGDIDEFRFQAAAGAQLNAFIQAARFVRVDVTRDTGSYLAAALSDPTDTGLFAKASGRFVIPQAGEYLLRVYSAQSYYLADTGSYRLLLYPIDPKPEHVAATIQPGDTISGESIDIPGDYDEFPVPGAPGDEFNVFFQARSGVVLQLTVIDSSGLAVGLVQSRPSDTSLTGQFTGRFALPAAGALRIHVEGTVSSSALDTGAYRFRLSRISRKPETVADTLVFGDSVLGERIDLPGDVDEFRVSIADSSGADLVAMIDSTATGGPLEVTLLDSTGHTVVDLVPISPGTPAVSGTMHLAPGPYTVRVQGLYNTSAFVGPYRVWLYKIGFGPEVAPDTIAIGDTITTEALDPPGDADHFRFFGRQGDHVNIALSGATSGTQGGFVASLTGPPGGSYAFVGAPSLADSLGAHQTNRVDLSATGWYTISVSGANNLTSVADTGPYRLALTRVGTAPEHAAAVIGPGDSVTNETMDFPEDWDEFTITAPPGQVLDVVASGAIDPYNASLNVFDSTTGASLAGLLVRSTLSASGRFTVPTSGQLELSVGYPRASTNACYDTCSFGSAGPYRFTVLTVNPLPESVPATFVVGDTVKGETIFPAGDLDEFTSSATPGDTLAPWYRLTADAVPAGEWINLRVIDPTTGRVLIGDNISQVLASPAFISPGQFVVPASGQFLVQVRAYFDNSPATAPYEFFVAPFP